MRSQSPPRWRTNVAILLGAVVLYLIGLQVYLSLRAPPTRAGAGYNDSQKTMWRYSGDPVLRDELVPGWHGIINDSGFVGPDRTKAKPTGAFRIVGLGDSITIGDIADEKGVRERGGPITYLSLAEQQLQSRSTRPVETLNFGVPGYDTQQEVRQLEVRGLTYQPDLITLGYCLNDWIELPFTVYTSDGVPQLKWGTDDHLNVIEMMRQQLAPASSEKFFQQSYERPLWKASVAALTRLAEISRERKIPAVVIIFPMLLDFKTYPFAPFHQKLVALVDGLGMTAVDLLPAFRGANHPTSFRAQDADTVHPVVAGHGVAAAELLKVLLAKNYFLPDRKETAATPR